MNNRPKFLEGIVEREEKDTEKEEKEMKKY